MNHDPSRPCLSDVEIVALYWARNEQAIREDTADFFPKTPCNFFKYVLY